MLRLVSGNPRKFGPLSHMLERLGITVCRPPRSLEEIQSEDPLEVLLHKAQAAHEALGGPCLVDDAGLYLDAYPGFPGPLTRSALALLGPAGFSRLLNGVTAKARMVSRLGCMVQGDLWHWQGETSGSLDPGRAVGDGPGPLSQWFVPDEPAPADSLAHRRRALEALAQDIDRLRLAIAGKPIEATCREESHPGCVFCIEFAGDTASVFHQHLGRELASRIVHRTTHFSVFPPLGQFIEGGLLLATREHILSMAHLPAAYYGELERLMGETTDVVGRHYGCRPVFFEHAPIAPGVKGTCCVDHAHLNVFPVDLDLHSHLRHYPHRQLARMSELTLYRQREQPYLFLQDGRGRRFVYEAGVVPSQLIRKIIARELGFPERGHWRDYLGLDELRRTLTTLAGWRSP